MPRVLTIIRQQGAHERAIVYLDGIAIRAFYAESDEATTVISGMESMARVIGIDVETEEVSAPDFRMHKSGFCATPMKTLPWIREQLATTKRYELEAQIAACEVELIELQKRIVRMKRELFTMIGQSELKS